MHNVLLFILALALCDSVAARGPCAGSRGISAARSSRVQRAFRKADITPDLFPAFTPTTNVRGAYPDGTSIDLGNEFSIQQTLLEPTITFTVPKGGPSSRTANYTLLMVDPDATSPSTPILRYFLHLMRYDLKPSCVVNKSPKDQAGYMAPTPASVELHRYIFLLYRQPEGIFTPPTQFPSEAARALFDLDAFVEEGNLTLVGGNFYREGLGSTSLGG